MGIDYSRIYRRQPKNIEVLHAAMNTQLDATQAAAAEARIREAIKAARLAAAAPEMLEALVAWLDADQWSDQRGARERARAIVAKAVGTDIPESRSPT